MTVEEQSLVYDPEICNNTSKISWSKYGFIAYANTDPNSINNFCITYFECIDGNSWQLAPPREFCLRSEEEFVELNSQLNNNPNFKIPPLARISLVSYSPNCADIAIADEKGNLGILVTGVVKPSEPSRLPLLLASLNEMEIIYLDRHQSSPIIAFQWLPLEKPVIINGPATKISTVNNPLPNGAASEHGALFDDSMGQLYHYNVAQHKSMGSSHPISSKQACIGLRLNGQIDIWYQGEHGLEYSKVTKFLELLHQLLSISNLSIAFTKDGKLVVATYSAVTKMLQLYTITIDWGYLVYASQMQKKMPHFVTPEGNRTLPTFKVSRLLRQSLNDVNISTGEYQILRLLEVVSPSYSSSSELDIFLGFETKNSEKFYSSVHVLKIEKEPLKSVFGSSNEGDNASLGQFAGTCLTTRHVINCPDLLLTIKPTVYNSFVILTYQTGRVEVLHRSNLEPIQNPFSDVKQNLSFNNPSGSLDQSNLELPQSFKSLLEVGFQFPQLDFNPQFTAMSPNLCSYVAMNGKTGRLEWKNICRDPELMTANKDSKQLKKGYLMLTASLFLLKHTYACFSQSFTEDIITTIKMEVDRVKRILGQEVAGKLVVSILEECQRAINFQLDYTRENADKLLNHPPFQKLLSLQLSLGTSVNWQRSKNAQQAYYLLHLRLCALIVTLSLRTIYHQIQKVNTGNRPQNLDDTYIKSNTLISLIGFVRWFIDFCTLLNKQLIEIGEKLEKEANDASKIPEIINNYIVIPLLLNTVSRSLLLYSIAGIRKLNEYSTKSVENLDTKNFKNIPIFESFERLNAVISSSPIPLDIFEKFISDTDNSIRNMKHDKQTSIRVETQLFCQAKIPKSYIEPIGKLCALYSRMAKKDFDLLQLYFYEVDWLECNDSKKISTLNSLLSSSIIQDTSVANHEMILNFKIKKNSLLIDELRKNLIISRNLRRCILCGSISSCDEIPLYNVDYLSPTSLPFQRSCFCGGHWVSL